MLRPDIVVEYVGQTDTPLDDRLALLFRFGYSMSPRKYDLSVVFDIRPDDADYAGSVQGILYPVEDIRQLGLAPKQRNVYVYFQRPQLTAAIDSVFGGVAGVPQRIQDMLFDPLPTIYSATSGYNLYRWWPDTGQWQYDAALESSFQDLKWRVYRHPNELTLGVQNAHNGVLAWDGQWKLTAPYEGLRLTQPDRNLEPRIYFWDGASWMETDLDPDAERGIEVVPDSEFMKDHGLREVDDWNMYPELLDAVLQFMSEETINAVAAAHSYKQGTASEEIDIETRRRRLILEERYRNIVRQMQNIREARRQLRPLFLGAFSRPVIRPRPVRRPVARVRQLRLLGKTRRSRGGRGR